MCCGVFWNNDSEFWTKACLNWTWAHCDSLQGNIKFIWEKPHVNRANTTVQNDLRAGTLFIIYKLTYIDIWLVFYGTLKNISPIQQQPALCWVKIMWCPANSEMTISILISSQFLLRHRGFLGQSTHLKANSQFHIIWDKYWMELFQLCTHHLGELNPVSFSQLSVES